MLYLDIMQKVVSTLILVCFIATGITGPCPIYAQDFFLPPPGVMVHLSPPLNPPILKGIKVHPDNPFRFDFILDKGNGQLDGVQLKDESTKLIKYFLASLTIPEKDLWVNLSPYEKDRIIPQSFGLTVMGRDLLAEDYILKQITASLIYPEDEVGRRFWKRIYEEAAKRFGTTNIPVNTFNKVWIVPEKAVVYENAKAGTAYVVKSRLKVMLEQDYLSLTKHLGIQSEVSQSKNTNQLGSQIVREIVIPELTKEINEDKNFSQLRQVYNSLILATWYKKKIKDSILSQVYEDKSKIEGVSVDDPQEKEEIYQRYLQAFKKGVYNYIKEEVNPLTQQPIPRKYFSGGEELIHVPLQETTDEAMVNIVGNNSQYVEEVRLDQAMSEYSKPEGFLDEGRNLVVLIGPSGSGKSTFRRKLIAEDGNNTLHYVPIVTTRKPLEHEPFPREFVFLSPQEFEIQQKQEEIIFVRENFGGMYKYGNYAHDIETQMALGKTVILETSSPDAVKSIKNRYPQSTVILFSSFDGAKSEQDNILDLSRRLQVRGVPPSEIERRVKDAQYVAKAVEEFQPITISNVYSENYENDQGWIKQYALFKKAVEDTQHMPLNEKDLYAKLFHRAPTMIALQLLGFYGQGHISQDEIINRIEEIHVKYADKIDNQTVLYVAGHLLFVVEKDQKGIRLVGVRNNERNKSVYHEGAEFFLLPDNVKDAVAEKLSRKVTSIDPWNFNRGEIWSFYHPFIETDQDEAVLWQSLQENPIIKEFVLSAVTKGVRATIAPRQLLMVLNMAGGLYYHGNIYKGWDRSLELFLHEFIHAVYDSLLTWEQRREIIEYFRANHPELVKEWEKGAWGHDENNLGHEALAYYLTYILLGHLTNLPKGFYPAKKEGDTDFFVSLGLITESMKKAINERMNAHVRKEGGWEWERDDAMITSNPAKLFEAEPGGIDLTANKTSLEIKNSGESIKLHLDSAMLRELQNTPGFVPVIINIQPMTDLKEFLGLEYERHI
jgi:guanylate kinase